MPTATFPQRPYQSYQSYSNTSWRRRPGAVSGRVMLSMATDRRSEPPPFWQPRPGPLPDEAKEQAPPQRPFAWSRLPPTPRAADAGAPGAVGAQTVPTHAEDVNKNRAESPVSRYETYAGAAQGMLGTRRTRPIQTPAPSSSSSSSLPTTHATPSPSPSSEVPAPAPDKEPRIEKTTGETSPSGTSTRSGSVSNLNAGAESFVPGQSAHRDALPSLGDIDLSEYVRQRVRALSARGGPSDASLSAPGSAASGSATPAEEDDHAVMTQWLDQTGAMSQECRAGGAEDRTVTKIAQAGSEAVVAAENSATADEAGDGVGEDSRSEGECRGACPSLAALRMNAQAEWKNMETGFDLSLQRARTLDRLGQASPPPGIQGPNKARSWLNPLSYDRNFLLQFKNVCKDRPRSFARLDPVLVHVLVTSHEDFCTFCAPILTGETRRCAIPPSVTGSEEGRVSESRTESTTSWSSSTGPSGTEDSGSAEHKVLESVQREWQLMAHMGTVPVVRDLSHENGLALSQIETGELAKDIWEARMKRLEARLGCLLAEAELLRIEIAQLRALRFVR